MTKEKCPICDGSKALTLTTGETIECPRCRCEAASQETDKHVCKVINLFTGEVIHEYVEKKAG